jgi:hypothetical protein
MRITRALAILAVASIMTASTAAVTFAQAPAPPANPARGFRVRNLFGEIEAVMIVDNTRFRLPGRDDITFADLKAGDRVVVLGSKSAGGVFTARLVNIEPRHPRLHQAAGTVTASSAASLTLKNLRGQEVTFVINNKTRIVPREVVIRKGDKVAVVGVQAWAEKDIVAKVITVKKAPATKTL